MWMKQILVLSLTLMISGPGWSIEINGFDLSSELMDANTVIRLGSVDFPKQALDEVKTETISNTEWEESNLIMGVAINGEARAYPLAIMMWHQIVNDELGGVPVLVTFCRLCGTGLVYDRVVDNKQLTFGMSGLIYRADILLYDKETNSLWSRFLDESVAGPSQGQPIFDLPYRITSLAEWKQLYPESTVISRNTGFDIDYSKTPSGTSSLGESVFAAMPTELRYHPDMPVIGVSRNGKAKAYPAGEVLISAGKVTDQFGGANLTIEYTVTQQLFSHQIGNQLTVEQTTWGTWTDAHPDTAVFTASMEDEG